SAPTCSSGARSSPTRAFARISALEYGFPLSRDLVLNQTDFVSICFCARGTDDLGPFRRLRRQERRKIVAEGGARLGAELADARDYIRRSEYFGYFVAQFGEHRLRRLRRSDEAIPGGGFEAGKPLLGDRRQVGQCRWPLRSRIGERAHVTGGDLRQHHRHQVEEHLHVPCDEIV